MAEWPGYEKGEMTLLHVYSTTRCATVPGSWPLKKQSVILLHVGAVGDIAARSLLATCCLSWLPFFCCMSLPSVMCDSIISLLDFGLWGSLPRSCCKPELQDMQQCKSSFVWLGPMRSISINLLRVCTVQQTLSSPGLSPARCLSMTLLHIYKMRYATQPLLSDSGQSDLRP